MSSDPALQTHLFLLSPWKYPSAYVAFLLHWLSSLVCIAVSLYFVQKRKGAWWALIALAFFLPLVGSIIQHFRVGAPVLPHGFLSPAVPVPNGASGTVANSFRRAVLVRVNWDFPALLVAIALAWAFLADLRPHRR